MDLSGQPKIKTVWSYDEGTDMVTVYFKSEDELTTFGDIIIEGKKFRSLFEPFMEVGRLFFPDSRDLLDRKFHRTNYDNRTKKALTEFDV